MRAYHLGIIPDGFYKYAKVHKTQLDYSPIFDTIDDIIEAGYRMDFNTYTIYLWNDRYIKKRPIEEQAIFWYTVDSRLPELYSKYEVVVHGEPTGMNKVIFEKHEEAIAFSSGHIRINLLWNYDARSQINRNIEHGQRKFLDSMDLVIKTGGEKKLLGFCGYEIANARLEFVKETYPEMRRTQWIRLMQDVRFN